MKLVECLNVRNELGEGVIWDHAAAKLWWTDIQQSQLYRYDLITQQLEQWATPERLCCFAPRHNAPGLVAAFASGFAFYEPENSQLQWLHKVEVDNPDTRLNDGRTDRQGRFWAGTMVEDSDDPSYKGSLYCLNTDLSLKRTIRGL